MSTTRGPSLGAECLRAGLLYVAVTFALAWPLTVHPGSVALRMSADTDLYVWTLGWDLHAFLHQPLAMFDANIYYPFRDTLAYSENLIGSALVAAPIAWVTGNLVLALNVVELVSCVLCSVGAYLLGRRVGIGPSGSLVAGLIFGFAPPRFFRIGQVHLTTVQWMPFCLASVHAYLDSGRRRDLWWASALFGLQAITSGHGAVFLAVAVVLLLVWRLAFGEPLQPAKRLRDFGVAGVLLLAVTGATFAPYRSVQRELGVARSLEESASFAPNGISYLASPTYVHRFVMSRLTARERLDEAVAFLFPGFVPLGLVAAALVTGGGRGRSPVACASLPERAATALEIAAVACALGTVALMLTGGTRVRYGSSLIVSARQPWRGWLLCVLLVGGRAMLLPNVGLNPVARWRTFGARLARWRDNQRVNPVAFYGCLAVVGLWLSLGPAFLLYRIVYGWPGFSLIRVPSRFMILSLLGIAIVAAAGFDRTTAAIRSRWRAALATATAAALVVEFFAAPLNAVPYSVDIPAVDRWLARQPAPFVVAEVPLPRPNDIVQWERRQTLFMLHSMAHWQRTIHGYSGLRPALHESLFAELRSFPDQRVLSTLAALGVTFVVVHTDLYSPVEWHDVAARLDRATAWLTLEHVDGAGRVYALRREPPTSARDNRP